MKGSQGLIVAVLLGVFGLALNYLYLRDRTKGVEMISFVGIKTDTTINPGDLLKEEHLVEVKIPAINVYDGRKRDDPADLRKFVYQYKDIDTVKGIRAARPYRGGELVFFADYRTAPRELDLNEGEQLIWVRVASAFVPDLVNPGDEISFILPAEDSEDDEPTPAGGAVPAAKEPAAEPAEIGPFVVGSLGNRLASRDVMKGSGVSPSQQNDIGLVVETGKESHTRAKNLLVRLEKTNRRVLGISLVSRRKRD